MIKTAKKFNLTVKILAILSFLILSCTSWIGLDKEKGEKYYQIGLEHLENGDRDAAVESFRKATFHYKHLAKAYYQLAKIYLKNDNLNGRVQADQALQNAVRYAPENIVYRFALARLDLRRGLTTSARNGFKRVLELDSTYAEAWHYLGYIHERELLHYQNLISPKKSGVTIRFTKFAERDLQQTRCCYTKAIQFDPTYLPSYYRLGFIYYELASWEDMIALFKRALQYHSNDSKSHLYLALAYHRNGQYPLAHQEYQSAWKAMSEEERQFYSSAEPLLSFKQKELIASQSKKSRNKFSQAFWKSRDPLYLTQFNERLMEHVARIAYANLRFSITKKNIEGWQTDRGKIYIRYGPPQKKVRTRAWLRSGHRKGESPLVPSKETWKYDGFQFVFEDRYMSGNYKFQWGFSPYDDYLDIYRRMVKKFPETYRHNYEGGLFQLPVIARQFARPDSLKALYLFSGVPVENVDHLYDQNMNKAESRLKKGIFVFDRDWQDVIRVQKNVLSRAILNKPKSKNYFLQTDSLDLPPETYHLVMEYVDQSGKHTGRYRDTLRIDSKHPDSLNISDIILANNIRLKTDLAHVNRNQIGVEPNFNYSFLQGQDLFIYYEIYRLNLNADGKAEYRVSQIVRRLKTESSFIGNLLSMLQLRKEKASKVTTTFDYEGTSTQENHYRILQLKDYKPGRYQLIIKVQDLVQNTVDYESIVFSIIERE